MPIYEFACPSGHRFERICSFDESEKPIQACPTCKKSRKCERVATAARARFKGAGFYNTTYQRSEAVDRAVEAGE